VSAPVIPARAVGLAAELAVLRALEAAGKRGRLSRSTLGVLKGTPTHLVHTRVQLAMAPAECDRLLAGVWAHLDLILPGEARLVQACDWYVRELIVAQRPHSRRELDRVLAVAYE
jgi:hypothetical protein